MALEILTTHLHWLLAGSNFVLVFLLLYSRHRLKKQTFKFKKLLDVVPCTISWVSSDLKYVAVNKRLASLIGVKQEEFIGQKLGFKEGNTEYFEFVESIFSSTEDLLNFEFSVHTPDGKREILCIANKVDEGKEATIIGVDVTQQKLTERSLFASARLATLGEMAGAIGHEINNPLTLIVNDNEEIRLMLQNKNLEMEKAMLLTDRIDRTSMRISKIIKGLKSFARDGSDDPFLPVLVKNIVDEALELCSQKFKSKGIELNLKIENELALIECQKVQIIQVLLNLLNNSYDAVKDSTSPWINLHVENMSNSVRFSVTDSGQGIPYEIQDKIFEPFFTTKEIGVGTGMGLSISKGIVEKHGGRLRLDTRSKNTKFSFTVPISNSGRVAA